MLGNYQQIQQVLMNIINNARYALNERFPEGDEKKKLFIYMHKKELGTETLLRTRIIDFGAGMSKENLNRVFDPFYTTKPQGSGTGLGMNISEGIINNHGGQISYRSRYGYWTAVTIDLPVAADDLTQGVP